MSVFLSNLDDFIAPSQACVNPLVNKALKDEKRDGGDSDGSYGGGEASSSKGRVTLETDFSTSEYQVKVVEPNLIKTRIGGNSAQSQKVASVSLNDCLACR